MDYTKLNMTEEEMVNKVGELMIMAVRSLANCEQFETFIIATKEYLADKPELAATLAAKYVSNLLMKVDIMLLDLATQKVDVIRGADKGDANKTVDLLKDMLKNMHKEKFDA